MKKWSKITASSNWTYIMVVSAIALVISFLIGMILAVHFPTSLFFSMPIVGLSASIMVASHFQLKKIG